MPIDEIPETLNPKCKANKPLDAPSLRQQKADATCIGFCHSNRSVRHAHCFDIDLSAVRPRQLGFAHLANQISIRCLVNQCPTFALLATLKLIPVFVWNKFAGITVKFKEELASDMATRANHRTKD